MKFIYNKFKFIKIIIYIYILIKIMEKQNILNFLEMENKEEILEKIDIFFGNPNFSKVEDDFLLIAYLSSKGEFISAIISS